MALRPTIDYSAKSERNLDVEFVSEGRRLFFREHTLSCGLVYVTLHRKDNGDEIRKRFGKSNVNGVIVAENSIYAPHGVEGIKLNSGLVLNAFLSYLDGNPHTNPTSVVSKDFTDKLGQEFSLRYMISPKRPDGGKETYLDLSYNGILKERGTKRRVEVLIRTPLKGKVPNQYCSTSLIVVEPVQDEIHPYESREMDFGIDSRLIKVTVQRKKGLVDSSEERVICIPRVYEPGSREFDREMGKVLTSARGFRLDSQLTLSQVMRASSRGLSDPPDSLLSLR